MYQHIKVPDQGQKITVNQDFSLNVPDNPIVPYIEGDGTGFDITPVMLKVVDAAVQKAYGGKRKIHWMEIYAGEKATQVYGPDVWLPDETLDVLRDYVVSIKGPLTTPVGGGIRSLDTIERYLDAGVSYVVVGTAAVKNPGFLHDACTAFPGQIIVGLDARDGKVATDGWSKISRHEVIDLARKFVGYGVEGIIYTDIGRDGMLSGVNAEATLRLAQAVSVPVYASGGVTDLSDIDKLLEIEDEGVAGVILGRSIYEGTLDFAAALERANGN